MENHVEREGTKSPMLLEGSSSRAWSKFWELGAEKKETSRINMMTLNDAVLSNLALTSAKRRIGKSVDKRESHVPSESFILLLVIYIYCGL